MPRDRFSFRLRRNTVLQMFVRGSGLDRDVSAEITVVSVPIPCAVFGSVFLLSSSGLGMASDPFGIRSAPLRTEHAGPVGYLRSAPGDDDAPPVDEQRRQIERYASAEGLAEPSWFADAQEAGDHVDRLGLRRLVTAVNAGDVTHLLVYQMNRLSTVRPRLVDLYDTYLSPQSVPLISISEHIDTSSPRGRAVIEMLRSFVDAPLPKAAVSDSEARARSIERRREVAAEGGYAGGRIPYGYRRIDPDATGSTDRVLRVHPHEASVVRRIFDLRREDQSLRAIAGALNDDDIAAPSGGEWHASTVRYVLDNETYFGYRTYEIDGEPVTQDLPHLQIIAAPRR